MQRHAGLVQHQAVVAVGAKLSALPGRRDELDVMVEDSREQRLLVLEGVEVGAFPRGLKVSGPFEFAVDRFVVDDALTSAAIAVARDLEQLTRARLAVALHERARRPAAAR